MSVNRGLPAYKSAAGLVRFLNPLLIVNAVVTAAFLIVLGVAMGLFFGSVNLATVRDPLAGLPDWLAVVAIVLYVGSILIVAGVSYAAAVFQYLWIYRVRRNLVALGVPGLRFTPGWSIAWFFVPVMNLFRPWQIMKETVRASQPLQTSLPSERPSSQTSLPNVGGIEGGGAPDPFTWKTAPYSPLVHLWWWLPLGIGLGWTAIYLAVFTVLLVTAGPQAVAFEGYALAVLGPLITAQPILTILLVRQVTRLQEAKHAALGGA